MNININSMNVLKPTADTKDALSDADDTYDDCDNYSGSYDDCDNDSIADSIDDEYYTTSDDEQETVVVKALVKAAFSRTLSAPDFAKFMEKKKQRDDLDMNTQVDGVGVEPAAKRARLQSFPTKRDGCRLPMVDSAPVLSSNAKATNPTITTVSAYATTATATATASEQTKNKTQPDDYLRSLLAQHGVSTKTFSALETNNFFLPVTAASVEAYDMQVVKAVRTEDLATLRTLLRTGRSLQCGNKFGESIVHTCCRRGSLTVLQFLLQEAAVSCRVTCDYGRTPLHDACWTSDAPNFQLMDLLLAACPDLLHVKDARGFLPLAYVRQEHWDDWCRYLQSKNVVEQLAARELV
jgi:hypothetical protein